MLQDDLDLDYFLFALPGIAADDVGQARISRAYAAGSRIPAASGLTGAEAAAMVMRAGGVSGVAIEPVAGELSDHYDPRHKVLRLSRDVYAGRSLAAVGVAAHEAATRSRMPRVIPAWSSATSSCRWPASARGLLAPHRGRAPARDVQADPAGHHLVFADRALPAHQPAGRVQRQPPRPADPRVHRPDHRR